MERYHHSKDQLLGITRAVSSLCDEIKSTPGIGEAPTGHWKHACDEIRDRIAAVVAPELQAEASEVVFEGGVVRAGSAPNASFRR